MSDIFSSQKRSDIMSKISGKNTNPEILVRKFLFSLKSATKPLNVLLACTHPLITEFADDLNWDTHFCLQYPLTPQCDLRQYAISFP